MRSDGLRVDWVDAAKAICIVFVVMMHSTLGVEKALGGATGFMHAVTEFAKPFRMPDFFLISGLFMARVVSRDWRTFIDKRINHFFYFYVLWLAIQYGFKGPGMVAENGVARNLRAFAVSLFLDPLRYALVHLDSALLRPRGAADQGRAGGGGVRRGRRAGDAAPADRLGGDRRGVGAVRLLLRGLRLRARRLPLRRRRVGAPAAGSCGLLGWGLVNGALVHFDYAHLPFVSLLLGFAGALAIVTVGGDADGPSRASRRP